MRDIEVKNLVGFVLAIHKHCPRIDATDLMSWVSIAADLVPIDKAANSKRGMSAEQRNDEAACTRSAKAIAARHGVTVERQGDGKGTPLWIRCADVAIAVPVVRR